jgi:hypothetical protein
MRKAEKAMIAFIEQQGYIVDFEREVWKEPRDLRRYVTDQLTPIMIIGWTRANAYKKDDIQLWKDGERKSPKPRPIYSGVTYCSASEPFNKAKGRILAVAWVLRTMGINREFAKSRVKHESNS